MSRFAVTYGLVTTVTLVGGLLAGLGVGNLVFEGLSPHVMDGVSAVAGLVPALTGLFGGAAAWGWLTARMLGIEPAALIRAGMRGFALPVIAAAIILLFAEGAVVGLVGDAAPSGDLHWLFALLFIPAAGILAAVGARAIGAALDAPEHGRTMARTAAIWAGLGFGIVTAVMWAAGWRVGAPGAAERFTMLTVLLVSCLGAALAGGTAMGQWLGQHRVALADGGDVA